MNRNNKNNVLKFRIDLYALRSEKANCNLPCSYCHLDYFNINSGYDAGIRTDFADLINMCVKAIGSENNSHKLHYSGRADPLLVNKEIFLSETLKIRDQFPSAEIVMTTNGIRLYEYSDVIKKSGIKKINVSHHNYSGKVEEKVFKGIEINRDNGIEVILNVVATEDVLNNIEHFIELGDKYKISLKFFNLLTDDKTYSEDLFNRFLNKLKSYCSDEFIEDTVKNRIETFSKSGNRISIKLTEKFNNRPDACQKCEYLKKCDESCWDTIRLTPWYIKPCGVREDNIYFPEENDLSLLKTKLISGGKILKLNN
jgi:molybdenum cofactor biosynthesis enzyme MoaA